MQTAVVGTCPSRLCQQLHPVRCRSAFRPCFSAVKPGSSTTPHQQTEKCSSSSQTFSSAGTSHSSFLSAFTLYLLTEAPAHADALATTNPFQGDQANSLYVTMALFLMCVPGIWSQVKRAPQASKTRKTFEVDGPAKPTAMPMDERARQIFRYFKKYNYEVKSTGEVITFAGMYAADRGQAAAVTFYTFIGMGSIALVLSTLYPQIGNWWYSLTLLSPAAWFYYFQKGERVEEVKVKMVTADDDQTTDIIIEGDKEEIERFWKELGLVEKGKILVKGIIS